MGQLLFPIHVVKKATKQKLKVKSEKPGAILAIGFDISLSSIAGCAKSYDPLLKKNFGPVWSMTRWQKEEESQWEKLAVLARGPDFIHALQNELGAGGAPKRLSDIYIGVEELPARVMNANRYREQAELFGAFISSLLKWGFTNVIPVNVKEWQSLIASDLDMKANKDFTKFHVAEWVEEVYGKKWTPLIRTNKGLVPKPKKSNAKLAQPDDRVDSTGIMEFIWENRVSARLP